MGWHHDVHSLLNSTWADPETQLNDRKYTLVSSAEVVQIQLVFWVI
jgi:hypothetical protein